MGNTASFQGWGLHRCDLGSCLGYSPLRDAPGHPSLPPVSQPSTRWVSKVDKQAPKMVDYLGILGAGYTCGYIWQRKLYPAATMSPSSRKKWQWQPQEGPCFPLQLPIYEGKQGHFLSFALGILFFVAKVAKNREDSPFTATSSSSSK